MNYEPLGGSGILSLMAQAWTTSYNTIIGDQAKIKAENMIDSAELQQNAELVELAQRLSLQKGTQVSLQEALQYKLEIKRMFIITGVAAGGAIFLGYLYSKKRRK